MLFFFPLEILEWWMYFSLFSGISPLAYMAYFLVTKYLKNKQTNKILIVYVVIGYYFLLIIINLI